MGLCPEKPHFRLNQILDARMMDILCMDHQDKFIYRTMYEIDLSRYDHYKDDLLQVVATCMWAREYHEKT